MTRDELRDLINFELNGPVSTRVEKIMALIDEYAGYKVGLVIKEWQEDRR